MVVQASFWKDCPSQIEPPLSGAGLVQVRVRFCHPRPQRLLHEDQSDQVDQPPLTRILFSLSQIIHCHFPTWNNHTGDALYCRQLLRPGGGIKIVLPLVWWAWLGGRALPNACTQLSTHQLRPAAPNSWENKEEKRTGAGGRADPAFLFFLLSADHQRLFPSSQMILRGFFYYRISRTTPNWGEVDRPGNSQNKKFSCGNQGHLNRWLLKEERRDQATCQLHESQATTLLNKPSLVKEILGRKGGREEEKEGRKEGRQEGKGWEGRKEGKKEKGGREGRREGGKKVDRRKEGKKRKGRKERRKEGRKEGRKRVGGREVRQAGKKKGRKEGNANSITTCGAIHHNPTPSSPGNSFP
ncbi:Histone-lysine N-methyltransferase, H3 lysine-79 specific, partial [Ophiophagus hannah]